VCPTVSKSAGDIWELQSKPKMAMANQWSTVVQFEKKKTVVDSPSSSDMRKEGYFVDAIVKDQDGTEWKIHKVIFSKLGIFVFNALTHPTFNGTLSLDIANEIAQCIIDFAYKGVCDINAGNVLEIFEAALMYQLGELVKLCGEFVIEHMKAEDALTVRQFVNSHDCSEVLRMQVDKFIVRNFSEVCLDEKIFELNFEVLEHFVKDDYLNIVEKDLLEGLMVMMKNNKKLDKEKAVALLGHVRHSKIDPIDYCKCTEAADLCDELDLYTKAKILLSVTDKYKILDLKMKAKVNMTEKDYSELTSQKRELYKEVSKWRTPIQPSMKSQQHRHPRDVIIAIGGTQSNYGTKSMEIFNIRTNNWTKVEFANELCAGFAKGHGLVILGHTLYHIGGLFMSPLKQVEALDLLEGRWMSKREMSVGRFGVTTVGWRKGIVAFGGSTGNNYRILDTAEIYNPETDSWKAFPSLTMERSGAAGVVVEDRIYAIGGVRHKDDINDDDTEDISEIEYYDPDRNEWSICGHLKVARNAARAVCVDGKVYVFGGRSEKAMETGECFEPVLENGKIVLAGFTIIEMPRSRRAFGMSVVHNKIVFTGGESLYGNGDSQECVVFCPRTNEWSKKMSMDDSREYHKSVTVDTSHLGIDWIKKLVTKLKPDDVDDGELVMQDHAEYNELEMLMDLADIQ